MRIPGLATESKTFFSVDDSLGWWDADSQCTLVVAKPSSEPDLWDEYVDGAQRSYRKHGVDRALDMADLKDHDNTALFFAAVDNSGRVIGGLRAKGPYRSPDDSHAVQEWHGQPGQRAVRKMINDRLPFGVVEMKTAWVTDEPGRARELTTTLARTAFPTMALLDSHFLMATAATHVLDRWRSSGGVVASKIPATPFPDERYRTKMMWWDRTTFVKHADPGQAAKIVAEMAQLNQVLTEQRGSVQSGSSS